MTSTTPKPIPPFRADQVGSLLRPPELRVARAKAKAGAISATQLREVEDRSIRAAVARQESIGLRADVAREVWGGPETAS